MTSARKFVEQEMEVNESTEVFPAFQYASYVFIVESLGQLQPAAQVVSRTDIVAWEDMVSAEATEQYVFGRPSADAVQSAQFGDDSFVRQRL